MLITEHTPEPFMKCMTMTKVNSQILRLLTSTHSPEEKETSIISIYI